MDFLKREKRLFAPDGLPILGWIDGFTGAYAFVTLAA